MAEYIWIDGSNGVRSKTKVSNFPYSSDRPLPARLADIGYRRMSSLHLSVLIAG